MTVDGSEVALILIDIWNNHWCPSIKKQTALLAKQVQSLLPSIRENGAAIYRHLKKLGAVDTMLTVPRSLLFFHGRAQPSNKSPESFATAIKTVLAMWPLASSAG
jgi:hypothetical protein